RRGPAASRLPGRTLLGPPGPGFRRSRGAAADHRPGPRGPRGEPHRAHVHRRQLGRLALPGAPPGGVREPARIPRPQRRAHRARRLRYRLVPLCAAREPAQHWGAGGLPPVPGARARPAPAGRGRRGPGPDRLRHLPAGTAGAGVGLACGSRPRRRCGPRPGPRPRHRRSCGPAAPAGAPPAAGGNDDPILAPFAETLALGAEDLRSELQWLEAQLDDDPAPERFAWVTLEGRTGLGVLFDDADGRGYEPVYRV